MMSGILDTKIPNLRNSGSGILTRITIMNKTKMAIAPHKEVN